MQTTHSLDLLKEIRSDWWNCSCNKSKKPWLWMTISIFFKQKLWIRPNTILMNGSLLYAGVNFKKEKKRQKFSISFCAEPGPPVTFDVTARGSTHFDLTWRKPLEPNGILTAYHISYQTSKSSHHQCMLCQRWFQSEFLKFIPVLRRPLVSSPVNSHAERAFPLPQSEAAHVLHSIDVSWCCPSAMTFSLFDTSSCKAHARVLIW